jgi:hypothetical protein
LLVSFRYCKNTSTTSGENFSTFINNSLALLPDPFFLMTPGIDLILNGKWFFLFQGLLDLLLNPFSMLRADQASIRCYIK